MNIIAQKKNRKLESSYDNSDLSSKDSSFVRAKEKRDTFLFNEAQQLMTKKGMRDMMRTIIP